MPINDVTDISRLREVEQVLSSIWGSESSPVPLDILRAVTHAGGHVAGCWEDETLVAASVATPADQVTLYSIVVGVTSGQTGRGLGQMMKQHQRAWALSAGFSNIRWTVDPLLRLNAHFNLLRLGAHTSGYEEDFFGAVHDAFNDGGPSDRLVVDWPLDADPRRPSPGWSAGAVTIEQGPDRLPAVIRDGPLTWLRIPDDIVFLRATDAEASDAWTQIYRTHMSAPMRSRHVTVAGLTTAGWYVLEQRA
ncbi:hypothetical protein [Aeromicrobium fastidiosum]|uniref:N-acetyltransferase domain-containing protein n=1 Tax=Aeromicrobium fastidiosum TaxID=52699 RepID=A0A641AMH2_9ACTN|nr:hypothetical protein [Aeromicrobium fastidiosum]KAA1378474.1 hypothetical protein ESP62_008965 [Aeromicrobium fastidiosum]MBP2392561.1 putative GNAT superfamily acetyltransferase [Aeromicrobium fastidiosum]